MVRVLKALALLLVAWFVLPMLPATAQGTGDTQIYTMIVDDLSPRVAGRPTDFTAVLADGGVPVAGATMTLSLQGSGSPTIVQATTDEGGRATVWATLDHNAAVQWQFAGTPEHAASASTPYVVQIAPAVTMRVHDRTLHRGQRFVATGQTFPAKAGCPVTLWRGEVRPLHTGSAPVRLGATTVRADGSYRIARRFHRPGRLRVVVTIAGCAGNAWGFSPYVGIRVR